MPDRLLALGTLTCLLLSGCTLVEDFRTKGSTELPAAAETAREAALVTEYLKTLEVLSTALPAEQAELAEHTRSVAATDPTIFNRLRHALVLAIPGHAASNSMAARDALGALLAVPEALLPAEVAIANVMRLEVDARILLERENQRLAALSASGERNQIDTLTRRLQTQSAENARLKQELGAALAKLEAVAALERNIAERRNGTDRPP